MALIDEGKLYAPEQGWADPLSYAGVEVPNGWEVQIQLQDESGKLPLNTMNEATLNRITWTLLAVFVGLATALSAGWFKL